jgi:hypothetical protein
MDSAADRVPETGDSAETGHADYQYLLNVLFTYLLQTLGHQSLSSEIDFRLGNWVNYHQR